ncbi:probable ubiquitin-conjugating enzyme E2 16 isoform X2 [Papaver somniferum]|uniref:probable ubiquitin-conjugating enzyme E2 16 isoform X2 n=1 Tax=Papaver somniferum TaxID=3469 RepID=UPI000E6F7B21|nr:probable ubiquitin-conjugating enzyme E2 16 isoform X2 [Papaver somniferum]
MTSSSAPSRKAALSKIASSRLQKELAEWQLNPPFGFTHNVSDNLQRWVIEVNGAEGTLYTDEVYQLQVDFPEHYPMEAPQVIFLNPAPLHPHIYSNGHICLETSFQILHYMTKDENNTVNFVIPYPHTARIKRNTKFMR